MAKSTDQIISEFIERININFSTTDVDTRVGTVMRDAFIFPPSEQLSQGFSELDQVLENQSIRNPEDKTEVVMDGHAENFGIDRLGGTFSSGVIRLAKFVAPVTDIVIAAGSRVTTTETGTIGAVVFVTVAEVRITATSPADPISGAAASIDASVVAEEVGSASNVDANTLVTLLDQIDGVDIVFNIDPTTNGQDSQTNTELAETIQARAQGRIGTKTGYEDLITSNFSVLDVEIIVPQDPDANRAQFGGAVDIVILNDQTSQSQENFPYVDDVTTVSLTPTFKPIESVVSITGLTSGAAPITLDGPPGGVGAGDDYDIILNVGPDGRSLNDPTIVVLHPTNFIPGDGTTLTMTYLYNSQIGVIQAFVLQDENLVVGSDVLVKAGTRVSSKIEADIRIIPGFSATTITSNATAAVVALFSSLELGDDVQESDVTTAIGNVEGVDFVDLDTFKLIRVNPDATETELAEIVAKKQEFIRASSSDITISII